MKKHSIIIFSVIIVNFFFSCGKDYLDESPISSLGTSNFYKNEEQIKQAVTGAYNMLLSYPDIYRINLSEVRSSNFFTPLPDAQRDYYDISAFTATSATPAFESAWANGYKMINRVNEVLGSVDNVTFSNDDIKDQAVGESKFLRAFAYFEMVQDFGGVPLVDRFITSSEALQIGRSDINVIYPFIVSDLKDAINKLPDVYPDQSKGKATSWAARALLGRVYMTMAGHPLKQTQYFDSAKTVLKQVIDQEGNFGIQFAPSYKEMFNSENDNKYYLFEVNYISGGYGLGNAIPGETLPADISRDIAKYGAYYITGEPSQELLDSYEPGDLRKEATISSSYVNDKGQTIPKLYFSKYLEPGSDILSSSDWAINFPLIRYADVLLLYAEAVNEVNGVPTQEAINILNRIRNRAGLKGIAPVSQADFRVAMETERRHEFAWEGLYWHDLIRTGKALDEMNPWLKQLYNKTISENQLIYPVPRSEMLIYPGLYTQNPDY